jgi:hypothetical protein
MHRLISITPCLALALATGCSSPTVDRASATKVMGVAVNATISGNGQVASANVTPTSAQIDITLNNPAGPGNAHILGNASKANGMVTESVDITFTNWVDVLDNVTLNGMLHESGTFSAPLPLAGNVQIDGALAASGSVNAMVDFNITGAYAPTGFDVSGNVGGNVLNASFGISAH